MLKAGFASERLTCIGVYEQHERVDPAAGVGSMGPSGRPVTAVLLYAKWFNPSCLAEMCEGLLFLTVGQEGVDATRRLDPICFRIVVFLYSEEQILLYQFAIEDLKPEKWCEQIARVCVNK